MKKLMLLTCAAFAPLVVGGPVDFYEFTAGDTAAGDWFGTSVWISGTSVGVGASRRSDLGVRSGAGYVFDLATGQELGKLTASDGEAYDELGWSIAMNDTYVLVGAPGDDGINNMKPNGGAVYVYTLPTLAMPGDRVEENKIGPAGTIVMPRDGFGYSVAMDDTPGSAFGVVGAPYDDTDCLPDFPFRECADGGSAYLVNATAGVPGTRFWSRDGFDGDLFGTSVDIQGFTVVVGAPYYGLSPDGSVYLFNRGSGDQLGQILSPVNSGEQFGMSVSMDNGLLVVGAPGNGQNGFYSGAAYLYDITDPTDPMLLFVFRPDDNEAFDFFGQSVSISGDRVAVGAPFDMENGEESGSVYVFDAATGMQIAKLRACSGSDGDNFGSAVSLGSGTLAAGAIGDDGAGLNAGAVGVYPSATTGFDCNANGEPDVCELADNPGLDCGPAGGNGILDECDIAADPSLDCDGNGVIDECELGDPGVDCDGNGVVDFCDIAADPSLDCDGNGVIDSCELGDPGVDCDGNGVVDFCDIAADPSLDCDGNGVIDTCELGDPDADCNGNLLIDACEIAADPSLDCDGNGLLDSCELLDPNLDCYPAGGNGVLDACDIIDDPSLDCDGNGVVDECEVGDPGVDCNANGVVDSCEIDLNPLLDCDGNGRLDQCDVMDDPSLDCNGNKRLDVCDIAINPSLFDCDKDGVVDTCAIAAGLVPDVNGNNIPDSCEGLNPPCSLADLAKPYGVLDVTDLTFFVIAFQANLPEGDVNGDGVWDVNDISLFLTAFNMGCP